MSDRLLRSSSSGVFSTPVSKPLARPKSTAVSNCSQKRARTSIKSDECGLECNINVYVRCRSRNEREIKEKANVVVSTLGKQGRELVVMNPTMSNHRTYSFDQVFGAESDQETVFEKVAKSYLYEMIRGYNCTLFAYGQTGTGKTYTMSGDIEVMGASSEDPNHVLLSENAGIIPRVLVELFQILQNESQDYSVKVSFLELYNEKLRDLLAGDKEPLLDDSGGSMLNSSESIRIFDNQKPDRRTSSSYAITVKGMEEIYISSAHEGLKLLLEGSLKRKVAATKCNDVSSRSHIVFTITTNVTKVHPASGEEYVKIGKLNLVDLAGSENITRSGAENKRAQEAGSINKSLLTLGRVINALVGHSQHIPYRESKLTRLLQDSLGGRTKTCIIATISPAKTCIEETVSTLEYATRARSIKNTPQVNQLMAKETCINDYIREIERLRKDLRAIQCKEGIYITQEKYDMYESNSILVDEQKAKIENLQDQIRRFKEKYSGQVNIVKEKEIQLKELTLINEKIMESCKQLYCQFDQLKTNVLSYDREVKDIHEKNLQLLSNVASNRQKIHEALLSKVGFVEKSQSAISTELNSLGAILNTLLSYNQRFKTVIEGVFEDLRDRLAIFEEITQGGELSVDVDGIDDKFGKVTDVVRSSCENVLVRMDDYISTLKSNMSLANSDLSGGLKENTAKLESSVRDFVTDIKKELEDSLQHLIEKVVSQGSATSELVNSTKLGLISQKTQIEKEIQTKSEEYAQKAAAARMDICKLVEQERQRCQEAMKASYEFLLDKMKESELRQKSFEELIANKLQELVASDGQTAVELCSFGLHQLNSHTMTSINSLANTITENSSSLTSDVQHFKVRNSSTCDFDVLKYEFNNFKENIASASGKQTTRLEALVNETYSCLKNDLEIHKTDVTSEIDKENKETCAVLETANDNSQKLVHSINTLVNYVSEGYKSNVMQISHTQDEIFDNNIMYMKKIADKIGAAITMSPSLQDIPQIHDGPQRVIKRLPSFDISENLAEIENENALISELPYGGADMLIGAPSSSRESIINSSRGAQSLNAITPVPLSVKPYTNLQVPRNLNSNIKTLQNLALETVSNSGSQMTEVIDLSDDATSCS
ncbi:HHL133Wp [Eremothecium sinecaudum]|uniref:Kinesin-like protein KIP1 n=1 Tax=Eremothecium sinecaudum TaxID=45286 RepID=A0A109UYH5_9SACH|nr:HHL133Wp [Eremothecium sinecaudum]AMD22637.1 HHL133Wp [Eremothecium sinecaudum]